MNHSNQTALMAATSLLELLEKEGYEARFVGGCVRDRLLGVEPKDYDIGSTALPKKCLNLLKKSGIKAIPTGLDHGTVTAIVFGHSIEITTLREDVSTDGRRAIVKFGQCFETDAARRDFTINALSEDREGKIFDYFGGKEHLLEKKLVFVGEAEKRIKEDYLRILRLYRFKARFNFEFDLSLNQIITDLKGGLSCVSQERITSEIEKIFISPYASSALLSMFETGLLETIFPFSSKKNLKNFVNYCEEYKETPSSTLYLFRMAALILLSGSSEASSTFVHEIALKLKLPNTFKRKIETLFKGFFRSQKPFKDQSEFLLFAKSCGREDIPEFYRDVCTPFWLHMASFFENKREIKLKVEKNLLVYSRKREVLLLPPPLSTRELMQLFSLNEGVELGRMLDERTRAFLNEEATNVEEMKIHLLKKFQ